MSVRSLVTSPFGWEDRKSANAFEGIGKTAAAKTNQHFIADCKQEGVKPTGRQYAKWRKKSTMRWRTFKRAKNEQS